MTKLLGTQGAYLLGVWHRQDQEAAVHEGVVVDLSEDSQSSPLDASSRLADSVDPLKATGADLEAIAATFGVERREPTAPTHD